jgi:hypothetical protein
MSIKYALLIIAGVITLENVDWERTGYNTYKFSALGYPSWDEVKQKAVDTVSDEIDDIRSELRMLDSN